MILALGVFNGGVTRASHFGIQWNRVSAGSFVVVILATGCTSSTEPPAEIHLEALTATSLMGTVASEVTVVRKCGRQIEPAWSPDGRRLAVTRDDCVYRCESYLMSADDDGKPPVFLASSAAFPAWSPDGKEIAYVRLSGDDGYHTTSGDSGTQEQTGWPWLRLTNSSERSNDGGSPCTDRSRA
jgi:dipeptidyl aminopeptidase/acylaminoacyl peptidase